MLTIIQCIVQPTINEDKTKSRIQNIFRSYLSLLLLPKKTKF